MPEPIRLYLVRHAIAADRGDEWPDDAMRPLTRKGIARMRRNIEGLRALGVTIQVILTSPLVRAAETAELLADGLEPSPPIKTVPALAPGGAPTAIAAMLGSAVRKSDDVQSIALVGHEPDLGTLAAWLIGAQHPLPFKKGGVCRIDVADLPPKGNGQLVWFAPPRLLRRLDRH
jgi:phosphohistidine phosphatase